MPAPSSTSTQMPAEAALLSTLLPTGVRLAALPPDRADVTDLHPLESLLVAGDSAERRQQFAAGRQCARQAISALGGGTAPLLRRRDGAPDWPTTIRGSITHKAGLCIAVAGPARILAGIGLDLEPARPLPAPAWSRVFTAVELRRLNVLPPARRVLMARLCFSAKESYYKWYRSQGGVREPDFPDVEVEITGNSLHVRPIAPGLPDARGRHASGDTWLITALWSYAMPTPRFPDGNARQEVTGG